MTAYCWDEKSIDLGALQERLENTDLIPSQEPLLDGLADKMAALRTAGITSLATLRVALKTPKSLASLSKNSGIDSNYLRLLRRAINGFCPNPRPLREIDWLDNSVLVKLKKAGVTNTRQMIDATSSGATGLAEKTGIDVGDVTELLAISNLCRIQWVSPTFARVLVAAGAPSAEAVAKADPEALFQAIGKANQGAKFYKGKIGLRDVRRLVTAATYVP